MRRYFHKHARNAGISEFIESLIQFYRSRRSKPRFFRRFVIRNAESSYRGGFISCVFENPGQNMTNRSFSISTDHAEYFHFFLRRAVKFEQITLIAFLTSFTITRHTEVSTFFSPTATTAPFFKASPKKS